MIVAKCSFSGCPFIGWERGHFDAFAPDTVSSYDRLILVVESILLMISRLSLVSTGVWQIQPIITMFLLCLASALNYLRLDTDVDTWMLLWSAAKLYCCCIHLESTLWSFTIKFWTAVFETFKQSFSNCRHERVKPMIGWR